jgi:antitoxin component YwqK of YwqJK toxin-antitoxin module
MMACRLNRQAIVLVPVFLAVATAALSQGITRQTWHDKQKKQIKEVYQVKDTIRNILHGRYVSYYVNGMFESKGQFTNNETTGVWEFFYETGNLKMRGILRQNANYGLWEYFYESGQKSMEGTINGKNREGDWKMFYENGQVRETGTYENNKRIGLWTSYFEDGVLRGEIDYTEDFGTYTEYYHSGKVLSEGPKAGQKNAGHWRFFSESGSLQSEGEFQNGKKQGEWLNYHTNGHIASKGRYENDQPVGKWEYFFDDGKTSSSGEYMGGLKTGSWRTLNNNGSLKSEATYNKGSGEYREYYASGKLKVKGKLADNKKEGKWEFFYEDGKREGECDYLNDKGTYFGYFSNGNLRTKGTLEGDQKTGTWEMYENDGKLSGYYRPFYDDRKLGKEIAALSMSGKATKSGSSARRLTYFDARFNEFRGVIVGGNPIMAFAGRLPVSVEFYLQERLGHEFEFVGIREPFFKSDTSIPVGKQFERGYSITIRQKMYNQTKAGMWYFGQEIRFTNQGHFVNSMYQGSPDNVFTAAAIEQRIEYGWLVGYRIMQRNNAEGFTIDAFLSADAGYRGFDVDPNFASYFGNLNKSKLSTSLHFGLNFGRVFSFR